VYKKSEGISKGRTITGTSKKITIIRHSSRATDVSKRLTNNEFPSNHGTINQRKLSHETIRGTDPDSPRSIAQENDIAPYIIFN
jgi:hypothetical protein